MGLQKQSQKRQFGPNELGILQRYPPRGFSVVVDLCAAATRAPVAGLFVFDDAASALFLSASKGLEDFPDTTIGQPLPGSVASYVRTENRVTRINELREAPYDASVEFLKFGIRSYLGAVVRGPADEPIGVLAVMHRSPYFWTFREAKMVEDMAFLLSQQIMLKASFETLRIMSAERRSLEV